MEFGVEGKGGIIYSWPEWGSEAAGGNVFVGLTEDLAGLVGGDIKRGEG